MHHNSEHTFKRARSKPLKQMTSSFLFLRCWHVAAHEVGHAIYNLGAVGSCFSSPSYESLLEEPRAELTAMFTLKLLFSQGVLDQPRLERALAHFALDALRYFSKVFQLCFIFEIPGVWTHNLIISTFTVRFRGTPPLRDLHGLCIQGV